MKTNGINNTGEISLATASNDKLIKMRDVAKDHVIETHREYMQAHSHLIDIQMELSRREISAKYKADHDIPTTGPYVGE